MNATGKRTRAVRFEELEAYRGVAAILVVIFHAYQYSREGTGQPDEVYVGTPWHALFHNLDSAVAWFFVLSGFLVFLPFARAAIERDERPSVRGFLVRRAVRILPPYYLALLIVWAWRYSGDIGEQWRTLAEHLTFTQIFDRVHIFWIIGPAWSLSVEVLFYVFLALVAPPICAVCGRFAGRAGRVAALATTCATLIVASAAYKWWAFAVARVPDTDFPVWFGPAAKLDLFALGMLLAVAVAASDGRTPFGRRGAASLRLAGGAILAISFATRLEQPLLALYFHTVAGLGFALILASTTLGPRAAGQGWPFVRPALNLLGALSYSLYLWHEPILIELGGRGLLIRQVPSLFPFNATLLVALSLAVAALAYVAVERPALSLRHLFTRDGRLAARYPELTASPAQSTRVR